VISQDKDEKDEGQSPMASSKKARDNITWLKQELIQ
jgi:hypothetical protein